MGHTAQHQQQESGGGAGGATDAKAFFVTSPTYNGFGADLEHLAGATHAAGVPLIVDQAWGRTCASAASCP